MAVRRNTRPILLAALRSMAPLGLCLTGCLLIADEPWITDECVNEDLGDEVGDDLAAARVSWSDDTYECPDETVSSRDDVVYAWTAPSDGAFEFRVQGDNVSPRIGIGAPECGGTLEVCTPYSTNPNEERYALITREFSEGEQVHIVVETRSASDGEFRLSISESTENDSLPPDNDDDDDDELPPTTDCPYQNDGECDEPEGTGLCANGTDVNDCDCPYQNDGECDEPEGTGLCSDGTDSWDCG